MNKVEGLRYKRTLFVGLGGAGAKTLRSLKRKIIRAKGEVPPQVKFLLIDTNATELANLRDFDSSEKVCIAVREPYQRYMHDKGSATHEFIPKQNAHSLLALERGAGQIRSNGHFAVIENQYSKKLSRVFRACADKLADVDIDADSLEKDPKIEVRLVFSIAGGTGSGTFLPISVLLRDAIQHCELTAYIYSATHFEKKVENSARYSVMQNAYAALCELDYMMHFGRNDKRYTPISFNFGPDVTQHIQQVNRPFEEVYYIDKCTSLPVPESVEFAYNELDRLQDNTADAMFLAATNIITAHTGTVDNVRQKILEGQFDVSDKFAWVSGLGLSEIFFKPANSDNPIVRKECRNSLKARITGSIEDKTADKIATGFIKCYKWNESLGPNDGDPVLNAIYDDSNERSKIIIRKIVDDNGNDTQSYESEKITLDTILSKSAEPNSEKKVETCVNQFKKDIQELIVSLINNDTYATEDGGIIRRPFVDGYDGTKNGMSLDAVQQILRSIESNFKTSRNKLEEEKNEQKTQEEQKGALTSVKATEDNSNDEKELQTAQIDANDGLRKQKVEAIHFQILKERSEQARLVFDKCLTIINELKNKLAKWTDVLRTAYEGGQAELNDDDDNSNSTSSQRKTNSVEVSCLDLSNGFRLNYEFIEGLYTNVKEANKYAGIAEIFEDVCRYFVSSRGSLHSYLVEGLDSIKKLANSPEVKLEKTECQKKIERLIDLATPTMQVDRHGYGEQINVDQFWYIMTDCPEQNIIDKPSNAGTKDDQKSVGALLKDLIEQNTLEAKVNLVHVPGWKDKAILYRVKSAVPVYFVDGVCNSGIGSYTLEGCYEELKLTKRTYSPFSHEILRQKLEHKVSALKPMDMVSDSKTLDYWINFILLEFVQKRGDTEKYTYCIDSQSCGERYSSNLLCRNKVLILGDTRADAYETFQRYCGELLKERKEAYNKGIKDFKSFGDIGNVSACDYVENENLCLYNKKQLEQLNPDDPDFVQLDREIKHLESRYKKFIEEKKIKEHNETVANCGSELCGNNIESNQTKSK